MSVGEEDGRSVDEWTLVEERPGKRIYSGFCRQTGDLVFMEEYCSDTPLLQAQLYRDTIEAHSGKDLRCLAVIPDAVRARALREGWYFDDVAWKRWMNDIDNNKLRVVGGRA